MRILLLTQWYPPEPAKLFADLAKGLQLQGHEVTVVTGFPNWPSGRLYPGYSLRLWQRETLDGVAVIRLFLYPDHSSSALWRLLNLATFVASAVGLTPFLTKRPDVIHAVQPPTVGWAAWLLSRFWRIPFTYEVQDMWPESLAASGLVRNPRALRIIGQFSGWVYSRAAAVRVISPGFRSNLIEKDVPAEKIHVISNWVDTAFFRPVPANEKLAAELGLSGRFRAVYAGVIGASQGLDTLVEAANLLRDLPTVQFVIFGDGTERKRLETLAKERGLTNNIRFMGSYPLSSMNELYALADVLVVHLQKDALFRITIPHKIFTYMASGRPILAAVEGNAADLISEAQAGIVCESGNPLALSDAIRRFHAMPDSERDNLGANGRKTACVRFSCERLVGEIGSMLQSVLP